MSSQNLSAQQINQIVPKKLKLENIRGTRERHGDFFLDGKYQFKVTLPNLHGGSGALSPAWLKVCRESVLLKASEYADLVRCPMERDDYLQIIRDRMIAWQK